MPETRFHSVRYFTAESLRTAITRYATNVYQSSGKSNEYLYLLHMQLSIILFLHREVLLRNSVCMCKSEEWTGVHSVNFGNINFGPQSSIKQRVCKTNNKYVFHSYVLLVIKTSSQIRYCSNKCPQRLFDFEALRCNALWLMVLKKRLSSQRGKGKLNS